MASEVEDPAVGAFVKVSPQEVRPNRAEDKSFTEGVWQELILDRQIPEGMRVHRFSYPPGGHSHWHWHHGEQAMVVVTGNGLVVPDGEEGIAVGPGDVVYVPPRKKHWHGATPENLFAHLAFTANGGTEWVGKVSDDEYLSAFD